jgi:HK97 family phage major capsid protein
MAMAGAAPDIAALERQIDQFSGETVRSVRLLQSSVDTIETELTDLSEKVAALTVGPSTNGHKDPRLDSPTAKALNQFARRPGTEYFNEYLASANADVRAAATVGSDPDGGFSAVPEFESKIRTVERDQGAMRGLASVMTTNRGSVDLLVDESESGAEWVGETEARPETTAPNLKKLSIPVFEIYAAPAATQTLLDDSAVDIGQWLVNSVGRSFAQKEGAAFVSGDGVNKPRGLLTYQTDTTADFTRSFGKLQHIAVGSATPDDDAFVDALIEAQTSVRAPYRANGSWLMNRSTLKAVRQLKDTQQRPLLSSTGTLVAGQAMELLGWPVAIDESMPDISTNSLSIAVGDFRQAYLIVDRIGIRVLRDPYTAKPYVLFYTTKRVGGSVIDFNAVRLMKFAA